ncbi:MAG: hypothetical protein ACK4I8_05675 [Armatimonadota bacterium]
MPPSWAKVEALEQIIVKAVKEAVGQRQISSEVFNELINEGRIAAYESMNCQVPNGKDLTSVHSAVVQHIRKVLKNYLPLCRHSLDDLQGIEPVVRAETQETTLNPLSIAVLLSTAAPIERLYALHELLGWEKPPRYSKTRLRKRWQENCGFCLFDSPVQGRHMDFADVNFVDGHAKVYKVRESGCSGLNINGQTIRQWCVAQAGPYQRGCNNPNPSICYDEILGNCYARPIWLVC